MDLTALNHEDPILKVLGAAQERIRKPENWCQGDPGFNAPDLTGRVCASIALFAVCGGTISGSTNAPLDRPARVYLRKAAQQLGYRYVADANDRGGHIVALAVFDRARELRMAYIMEVAHAA